MVYYQSLVDNFNDNSLNTELWELLNAGVTESSSRLNLPCTTALPGIRMDTERSCYDITKGIIAAKMTRSGTATANSLFSFGVRDQANGNFISIRGTLNSATIAFVTGGGLTLGSTTIVDTTVGMGSSWAAGTWIGIGNMGADNIIHVYKSTNGQTWTEIARTTLTAGSFDKTRVGHRMQATESSGSSTFVMQIDDASFFSQAMVTFIYDSFNDNSIDTSKWEVDADIPSYVTETGGRLVITPVAANSFPSAYGFPQFDLRKGIVAAKLSKSGSTHSEVYTSVGINDIDFNTVDVLGRTTNADLSTSTSGLGTYTTTIVDTTVGFGPSWAANTLVGWTYSTTDNTLRLVKSTDAVNWTEMCRFAITVPGAFDFTRANITLSGANFATGSSNMAFSYEDAVFYAHDQYLRSRVRVGNNWAWARPKVRVGGAWVSARSKVRVSGSWQDVN